MKSAPLFMDAVRSTLASSCRFVPYEKTELRLASLGEETNIVGAASVWYHRFGWNGGARAI
jgi:glucokinase